MGSDRMLEEQAGAAAGDALWRITLADEMVTARLAAAIALLVTADDLVTLSGGLRAGKAHFARSLIREILKQPDLAVVSPTFTLMQTYDGPDFPIVHVDLYRIESESE